MIFEDKKKAHREKCLAYYYNNKEKVRQRYAENREKILEYMRVYNAEYYQRMKKQDMENEKAYVNVFKPPRKRKEEKNNDIKPPVKLPEHEFKVQTDVIEYFDEH